MKRKAIHKFNFIIGMGILLLTGNTIFLKVFGSPFDSNIGSISVSALNDPDNFMKETVRSENSDALSGFSNFKFYAPIEPCEPYVSILPTGPITICESNPIVLSACNQYTISGIIEGSQEIPPNQSAATGSFTGLFNAVTNELTLNISFSGLTATTTVSHIHNAPAGVNGGVIVDLFPQFPTGVTSGTFSKTVILSNAHAAALIAGNTYINIHTVSSPGGEIRGQITPVNECPGISYLWSTGETTPSINVSASATYTVTATDISGCTDSENIEVTADPAALVDAGPDQTICATDTIYLNATLSGLATSGVWQKNVAYGTFLDPDTWTSTRFVLSEAGMLLDSISFGFMTNDPSPSVCEGGLDTVMIYITQGAANFRITPTGPLTVCETDPVILNAECNIYNFAGSAEGSQEVPANPSTAVATFSGRYNVEENYLSITINFSGLLGYTTAAHIHRAPPGVNGPVIASFMADFPFGVTSGTYNKIIALDAAGIDDFLSGDAYVNIHTSQFPGGEVRGQIQPVIGCQGVSYLWNTGETTTSINVTSTGTYSAIASSNDGCTDFNSIDVTIDPAAIVDAGPDQNVCSNDIIYLNATLSGLATGGVWEKNVAYGTFLDPDTWPSTRFVLNAAGMLLDSISFGFMTNDPSPSVCEGGLDTVMIYINPAISSVTLLPSDFNGYGVSCKDGIDGTITTVVVGGSEPFSYLWNTGEQTESISGLSAGTYTVTVSGACGDPITSSVTLTEPPLLTVTTTATSDFGGFNVSCNKASDGTANASASGGTGIIDYLWSNGDTGPNATGLSAGTHTVTVTDANGCIADATVFLTEPDIIFADAGPNKTVYRGYPDSSCTVLQATGTGGLPPYTYLWSNGLTTSFINVCPVTSRTFYVTITDANGCESTDSVRVCAIDVRCGSGKKKVRICHATGSTTNPFRTICVEKLAAAWHFQNHSGDQLGTCGMSHSCDWTASARYELSLDDEITETEYYLNAFPNPLTNSSTIRFMLAQNDYVKIRVMDLTGREVELLYEGYTESGFIYDAEFDGTKYNQGIYFLVMTSRNGAHLNLKLVLNK